MQEHAERIKRLKELCDQLDRAIRTSKSISVRRTLEDIEAETTALARALKDRPGPEPSE